MGVAVKVMELPAHMVLFPEVTFMATEGVTEGLAFTVNKAALE